MDHALAGNIPQVPPVGTCPVVEFYLYLSGHDDCRMDFPERFRPVHATRWRNFRQLLKTTGLSITAAAEALGKKQPQVSHFGGEKRPSKVIGDQIAGEIEEAFDLPFGWLDHASREGTVSEQGQGVRRPSQFEVPEERILAEAEKWLRFEERTHGLRFRYPGVRRLQRSMELVQALMSRGVVGPGDLIAPAKQPTGGKNERVNTEGGTS